MTKKDALCLYLNTNNVEKINDCKYKYDSDLYLIMSDKEISNVYKKFNELYKSEIESHISPQYHKYIDYKKYIIDKWKEGDNRILYNADRFENYNIINITNYNIEFI